jgi:hypothetical protein
MTLYRVGDWQEGPMSGDTLVITGYTGIQKADGSDDTKKPEALCRKTREASLTFWWTTGLAA